MDYYTKIIRSHELETQIERLIGSGDNSLENRLAIANAINEYEQLKIDVKKRLELSIDLDNRTKVDALGEQLSRLLATKDVGKRPLIDKLMNEYEQLMQTINEENKIMEKYGVSEDEYRFTARLAYLKDETTFEDKLRRLFGMSPELINGGIGRKRKIKTNKNKRNSNKTNKKYRK
jgi:hypothetical protein